MASDSLHGVTSLGAIQARANEVVASVYCYDSHRASSDKDVIYKDRVASSCGDFEQGLSRCQRGFGGYTEILHHRTCWSQGPRIVCGHCRLVGHCVGGAVLTLGIGERRGANWHCGCNRIKSERAFGGDGLPVPMDPPGNWNGQRESHYACECRQSERLNQANRTWLRNWGGWCVYGAVVCSSRRIGRIGKGIAQQKVEPLRWFG